MWLPSCNVMDHGVGSSCQLDKGASSFPVHWALEGFYMLSSSACRHMLVRKWREVVRQEVRAATTRAKQLETRAWLEKGIVVQVQAYDQQLTLSMHLLYRFKRQREETLRVFDCVYTI